MDSDSNDGVKGKDVLRGRRDAASDQAAGELSPARLDADLACTKGAIGNVSLDEDAVRLALLIRPQFDHAIIMTGPILGQEGGHGYAVHKEAVAKGFGGQWRAQYKNWVIPSAAKQALLAQLRELGAEFD